MPRPGTNSKSLRKLNRFSFRFIEGKIDFHSRYNSLYKDEELLFSLIYLSIRNKYPENGCKRLKEIANKNMPDADTFYDRLGKKSMQEIRNEFMNIQRNMIEKIRRKTRNKEIIVLIDEHEIPWFGEPNEHVLGTKNFNGTKFCFKYITINALIEDYRICLYALPVTPFSRKDKLVDELLCVAKNWFKIGLVLIDRGFSADSRILNVVEKHGLKYIAPMEKYDRIKKLANLGNGVNPFYHTFYEFGKEKVKTNLFFIPNGKMDKEIWKRYHVFCTNIDVTKANIEYLAELYGKRWNIENFYRDAEKNFIVRTKTEDFIVRYFFFLFMSLLYNLWYFIKTYYSITAEEWKDLIEEELLEEEKMKSILRMLIQLKLFYFSFWHSYRSIFCYYFLRYRKFFKKLYNPYFLAKLRKFSSKIVVVKD